MCISHNLTSSRDVVELALMAIAGLAWPWAGSGLDRLVPHSACRGLASFPLPSSLPCMPTHTLSLLLQTAVAGTWLRSLASVPFFPPWTYSAVFSEDLGHTPFVRMSCKRQVNSSLASCKPDSWQLKRQKSSFGCVAS